MLDSVNFIACY